MDIKAAIETEIENYIKDSEYDNVESQMRIFNELKDLGYDHDQDVKCVNIATETKSGLEVFRYILTNVIPRLRSQPCKIVL